MVAKKKPAAPAYKGALLPLGHVVTSFSGGFEVVRTLNHDAAASEIVVAKDLKMGGEVVLKVEALSTPSPQAYNDEAVLFWLSGRRGQGQLVPGWRPDPFGLPSQRSRCQPSSPAIQPT
jgi:hypothetical protein